jgi:hypothetical protein
MTDLATVQRTLETLSRELPSEQLPEFVALLEATKARAWVRIAGASVASAEPERLLTAEEIAPLIGLSAPSVRDRRRRGIIPGVPLGGIYRYVLSDVIAALKARGRPGSTRTTMGDSVASQNPKKNAASNGKCPTSVQVHDAS